ncbi:MAG: hypothetical protein AUJ76_01965 [Candidatus Omnitrophica bacterium CG1_02_41_171]|nr:MAG: hypothetical protein AUJ76_01965 [Candidatus Omnitrophica bacterium CG1_02_41_171]
MTEGINRKGVIVLVMALVSLMLGVSEGFAADWLDILGKMKAKYAEFEKEAKDMTILQEIKAAAPQEEVTSEMKILKKGRKFRIETSLATSGIPAGMEEMKAIIISDGKDSWMISPFTGKKKISEEEEKRYQKVDWWNWFSEKAKIVGTEKVGERECYVVEVEEGERVPFTKVWIDKKELLLVKGEAEVPVIKKKMGYLFSDFRKIEGGWELPYRIEISMDGSPLYTSFIKSLEINSGLSDDLFDPDKVEVKGPNMQEMMKKMMQRGENE